MRGLRHRHVHQLAVNRGAADAATQRLVKRGDHAVGVINLDCSRHVNFIGRLDLSRMNHSAAAKAQTFR